MIGPITKIPIPLPEKNTNSRVTEFWNNIRVFPEWKWILWILQNHEKAKKNLEAIYYRQWSWNPGISAIPAIYAYKSETFRS